MLHIEVEELCWCWSSQNMPIDAAASGGGGGRFALLGDTGHCGHCHQLAGSHQLKLNLALPTLDTSHFNWQRTRDHWCTRWRAVSFVLAPVQQSVYTVSISVNLSVYQKCQPEMEKDTLAGQILIESYRE